MTLIREFSEPGGFMRTRQVRVRALEDGETPPTDAVVVPGGTQTHDWRPATIADVADQETE